MRTRLLMVVAPIVLISCTTSSTTKMTTSSDGIVGSWECGGLDNRSTGISKRQGDVAVIACVCCRWSRLLWKAVEGVDDGTASSHHPPTWVCQSPVSQPVVGYEG